MKTKILIACSIAVLLAGCGAKQGSFMDNQASTPKTNAVKKENLTLKTQEEIEIDKELSLIIGGTPGFTGLEAKDENKIVSELLTNSPSFAEKNVQGAVKENMVKLPNTMPLFRQPLFAQLVVFPYVSDDGVYHGYSESWVKVKEGNFVLSDPRNGPAGKERIFDINAVGK